MLLLRLFIFALIVKFSSGNSEDDHEMLDASQTATKFQIEGKILLPDGFTLGKNWQVNTRVLVNYGEYVGFVSIDDSFVVNNVPPGSYIVEVANKDYIFEPVRVDINSKGKVRARRLQLLQPAAVNQLPYPLRFKPKEPTRYFQVRETWRITDFLFSPMVMMMVLPLLCIMVLPRLIDTSDPEVQREMRESVQLPKYEMPELSEFMTNLFGGSKKTKPRPLKKKTN